MRVALVHFDGQWSHPLPSSPDESASLVLAFGPSAHPQLDTALQTLRDAYPRATFFGCSTAGEILGARVHDSVVSAAVVRFEHTHLATAFAPVADPDHSFDAGRALAKELLDKPRQLKAVWVLSDGLAVNGSALVRGLTSQLPSHVSVSGGLAGDGDRFMRTWVLHRGERKDKGVVALGLWGDRLVVGTGSRGGWDVFGPERVVSRSRGAVLHELDGRPALALYKEYLGDRAQGLPATALLFPLSIRMDRAATKTLVRTVVGIDEAQGTMTFAGDVPMGSLATLMRANLDRLITGAADAAVAARLPHQGQPVLALAVSCVGRRLVLGAHTEEETEATLDALGPNTHQIGFYAYGEISPFVSGSIDLHNQTMTLTTVCERSTGSSNDS